MSRKTLGLAQMPVSVPLWVLTDLCMAAEQGGLAKPANDALKAAHKAIKTSSAERRCGECFRARGSCQ